MSARSEDGGTGMSIILMDSGGNIFLFLSCSRSDSHGDRGGIITGTGCMRSHLKLIKPQNNDIGKPEIKSIGVGTKCM